MVVESRQCLSFCVFMSLFLSHLVYTAWITHDPPPVLPYAFLLRENTFIHSFICNLTLFIANK